MTKKDKTLDFSKLQAGSVLSEISYYTVLKVEGDQAVLGLNGEEIEISRNYLETMINSADQFDPKKEQRMSRTDVINVLKANPRIACSIYYRKKDTEKSKRAFADEKSVRIKEIQSATLTNAARLLENLIDNPISKVIPGDMRLIKGFHENGMDAHGRLMFSDMEDLDKNDTPIIKGVDTRTIEYIIVNNIKYTVKK